MKPIQAEDMLALKAELIASAVLPQTIKIDATDPGSETLDLSIMPDERVYQWLALWKNSPHRHVSRFNIFAIGDNFSAFAEELGAAYTMRDNIFACEAQVVSDKLSEGLVLESQEARSHLDEIGAEAAWRQSKRNGEFNSTDATTLTQLSAWATNVRRAYTKTPGHPLNATERLGDAEAMYRFTLGLILARTEAIRQGMSRNYGIELDEIIDQPWLAKNPFPRLREWMRDAGLRLSSSTRAEVRFNSFRLLDSSSICQGLKAELETRGSLTRRVDLTNFLPKDVDWSKWRLRLLGINACLVGGYHFDTDVLQDTTLTNANSMWVVGESRAARQTWSSDLKVTLPDVTVSNEVTLAQHDVFLNGSGVFGAGTTSLDIFLRPFSLGTQEGRPLPNSVELWIGNEVRFAGGTTDRVGLARAVKHPPGGGGPTDVFETLLVDVALSISVAAVPLPNPNLAQLDATVVDGNVPAASATSA